MIEQKSLVFLGTEAVLLSLLCLSCLRVGTDLLFRERAVASRTRPADALRYGVLDWSVLSGMALVLLCGGLFWPSLLRRLETASALFLQP